MRKVSVLPLILMVVIMAVFFQYGTGKMSLAAAEAEQENSEIEEYAAPPGDVLPNVTAKSAVVMEAKTGKVIYSRNMRDIKYPASTTKIMTLIVALENGNLNDEVTASEDASKTEGSTIWLETGEKRRMLDLLYGMMLVSGNDATVAVAEHIAGSVPAFAQMMTEKAHSIGAKDTFFVNSSGLPDEKHYTTAYDMALIAAYGYNSNPMFEQIVSTKEKQIPWADNDYDRVLGNENRMLWLYEGGNGVKTGYTDAAGRCLVSAAKRDGVQLIAVVLDSLYMWNDSIAMLDYGFEHIKKHRLVKENEDVKTVYVSSGRKKQVQLKAAEDFYIPIDKDDNSDIDDKIKTRVEAPDRIEAAINKGDHIGDLFISYEGREIGTVPLVAAESIEKKSFFCLIADKVSCLLKPLYNI